MTYYFAYGMNTNLYEMRHRCPDAENLGVGYLDDHKMVFKYHADMIESPGHTAPGVLWKITDRCLESLDMLEGFPVYYNRRTVKIRTESGEVVDALMYYMVDEQELCEPSAGYYYMLWQGYNSHKIPVEYLKSGYPAMA